jgi:gamma-aminobutyric acid type B receptor
MQRAFSFKFTLIFYLHRQRLNKNLTAGGYDIDHYRFPEGYQEAPLAYDAVWSVALAFNKTMERLKMRKRSLKDFTYTDKEIAEEIYAAMNSTQFLGVSVSGKKLILRHTNFYAHVY